MVNGISYNSSTDLKQLFSKSNQTPQNQNTNPSLNNNFTYAQQKKPFFTTNKLQIAFLTTGTLLFALTLLSGLKGFVQMNKGKELLQEIQRNKDLPQNVSAKLMLEYEKFKNSYMDTDGLQNYIRNVLRLPWNKPQKKLIDIEKATRILNEDLLGLDDVKDKIIRFLTFQNYLLKHNIEFKKPLTLCLVVPPGTAKTTLAEIIAKAMDRPYSRISLAGVDEKTFIKGAGRVYRGSWSNN